MIEKFHYRIFGAAKLPKLVFLHGLMGFSSNWGRIIGKFVNNFNILVYDQRGHGRSHKPVHGYKPEDYAQDLKEILTDLKWDTINLVGHSMGGRNALCFAVRFPERVTRLVIEDIGPEAKPNSENEFRSMLESIPIPFGSRNEANKYFTNEFHPSGMLNHERIALAQYLMANLVSNSQDQGLWTWRFSLRAILETVREGRATDRWNEIELLTTPTLVIRGELSQELDTKTLGEMARVNPLIQTAEIKGAGHWVHFEKPGEFAALLSSFLLEPLSRGPGLKTLYLLALTSAQSLIMVS